MNKVCFRYHFYNTKMTIDINESLKKFILKLINFFSKFD